jgi:hypothetical protein
LGTGRLHLFHSMCVCVADGMIGPQQCSIEVNRRQFEPIKDFSHAIN